ncbi:MAG: hypothetical protein ACJAY8_000771 [Sphingobacteriales bacterium]|jgi:hypothetical protein
MLWSFLDLFFEMVSSFSRPKFRPCRLHPYYRSVLCLVFRKMEVIRRIVVVLWMGLISAIAVAQTVKQYADGVWSFQYLELPTSKNWCSTDLDLALSDSENSPEIICNCIVVSKEAWFYFRAGPPYLEVWIESSNNQGNISDLSVSFFDDQFEPILCINSPTQGFLKMASPLLESGKGYFVAVTGKSSNNGKSEFDICLKAGLSNDFFKGAIALRYGENIDFAPGELQMDFHSGEGFSVACSNDDTYFHDVWYSFISTGEVAEIVVQMGLGNGLLKMSELAVFNEGKDVIKCASQKGPWKNISLVFDDLVPGKKYFVAINSTNRPDGFHNFKFGLKIRNYISNDHPKGAFNLDNTPQGCFAGTEFSTEEGTHEQDLEFQFCSGNSKSTKWFRFQALEHLIENSDSTQ